MMKLHLNILGVVIGVMLAGSVPCWAVDCNGNGIPDDQDIADGTSGDCDNNGVPDECQLDCNGNGEADICEIFPGNDCNRNNILDECIELEVDCNGNAVPDRCDLSDETSADCNSNEVPDECDIADGTSVDSDLNEVPDECEDCNKNGIPDGYELANELNTDCDGNAVPDDCDPDCNMNGVPDSCDLTSGTSADVDSDGIPDDCGKIYFSTRDSSDDFCDAEAGCPCRLSTVDRIQRVNPDGSHWEPLTSLVSGGVRLSIDRVERRVYWADGFGEIHRANLDGTGDETIFDSDLGLYRVALDPIGRKLYWVSYDPLAVPPRKLHRANLDGSNVEEVLPIAWGATNVFVDPLARTLYWSRVDPIRLERANLDGSGHTTIYVAPEGEYASPIALDLCEEQIYFLSDGTINRVSFDGQNVETPFDSVYPSFVTLDMQHRFLYWTERCGQHITQVNIDDPAKKVTTIDVGDHGHLKGIAVDPVGGDCNNNGVVDRCETRRGYAADCNFNEIPDECEPDEDCNNNGTLDICDIAAGSNADCNSNNILDECEFAYTDCNGNQVWDACDITLATSEDCTGNGVPDECEPDCNGNGIADSCDIADGVSIDCDGDSIPDDCQPTVVDNGSRYITIHPRDGVSSVALLIRGEADDPDVACVSLYVQGDGSLGETPVFRTPAEWCTVHAHGPEIIPDSLYDVLIDDGKTAPNPLTVVTAVWGDSAGLFIDGAWEPADGAVNITDAVACIDAFAGLPTIPLERCDLDPEIPNGQIDIIDILRIIEAFAGVPYPHTIPCN